MAFEDYTRQVQEPPVPVVASVDAYMLAEMLHNLNENVIILNKRLEKLSHVVQSGK